MQKFVFPLLLASVFMIPQLVAQAETDRSSGTIIQKQKKTFKYKASCLAECTDGKCRYFECAGELTAYTNFGARLAASLKLKQEVKQKDGKVDKMTKILISVDGEI